MLPKIDEILDDITNGTTVGVSDDLFKDSFGTATWIIENERGTQWIMGNILVTGFFSYRSAYRSDIVGIYVMVMVMEEIKYIWGVIRG